MVGRAIYQKGIHIAIAMFGVFKKRYPSFCATLTICGDGRDIDYLKQYVNFCGVEQDVVFLGGVPYQTVAEVMERSDILLIPSVPVVRGGRKLFVVLPLKEWQWGYV